MSTRGERDPWVDNAKMTLVVLVVVGHSWTLLPGEGVIGRVYDFLYAWHIPAFAFVTGYLSRTFSYRSDRIWRLIRTVLVPYLLFEAAMGLFRIRVGGEHLEDLFLDPHWPMWFLLALAAWRLMTPLFRPLPAAVVVAVVASVAGGLWTGELLDMARIVGFLPFYVLGLKATPERLEWLRGRLPWVLAVVVFAGIWVVTAHTDRWAATEWLYYRTPYHELGVSDARGMATRAVLIAIGVAGTLAFLALVPRRDGWFARMGRWTLVVYLLHGFAVRGVSYTTFPDWAATHPTAGSVVTTAGAVGLALLLASPPVTRLLVHAVDPLGTAERQVTDAVSVASIAASHAPDAAARVAPVDDVASVTGIHR